METYTNNIKRKLWITRGSRFEAHKYYLTKHDLSSYAIGFFSAYVIIINFLGWYRIFTQEELSDEIIQFSTMTLSVLILAFSQLEAGNEYKLKAERFHECSKEISKLLSDLEYITKSNLPHLNTWTNLKSISDNYESLIQKHSDNHQEIHYSRFKASHPKDFDLGIYETIFIKVRAYIAPRWLYTLLIVAPPVVFFILLSDL